MVEKSRPRKLLSNQLPEPIEKIAKYYNFSVTGRDRVADRTAWVVSIVPRDGYRYGYQLWIDEESKLLLKSKLKGKKGRPLEQILFTQIEIMDNIPDNLLKPAISGTGYTWYNNATDELPVHSGNGKWRVTWMPNGFVMSDQVKQVTNTDKMPVNHMSYTDGLATVSVFVEKIENDPDVMKGPSRMGGVNAFATFANGYQVTAVGEVPQETVQLMADSVVQSR
jgi:sigma-E factor negative regulatory protein RseB